LCGAAQGPDRFYRESPTNKFPAISLMSGAFSTHQIPLRINPLDNPFIREYYKEDKAIPLLFLEINTPTGGAV